MTASVVPAADTNERAGLVSRTVAAVVDIAVVLLAVLVGYLGVAGARLVVRPRTFAWPEPGSAALTTIAVLVMVVYLGALWSTTGRTGGDQLMGIRVVNDRGERIGMARALARSALCVVFPVGLLWCAVDQRRRSVQDVLIHTTVIYDWRARILPQAGATRADA